MREKRQVEHKAQMMNVCEVEAGIYQAEE